MPQMVLQILAQEEYLQVEAKKNMNSRYNLLYI